MRRSSNSELAHSAAHQFTKSETLFVWAGGGLFVSALAFCAYSYLVTWSSPNADVHSISVGRGTTGVGGANRWAILALDLALFTVFAAHHSLLARNRTKAWLACFVPPRLIRTFYVWTASLLFIVVCILWQAPGGDLYDVTGWPALGFAAVQLAGIALSASSVRAISALELAGIRRPPAGGPLQIAGPYRWVRHPLYLGWMLAVFGAGHMTGARLSFAAISSLYLVVAIPWEERSLAREFPAEYSVYRQQVRWRVVPYVY